MKSEKDTEERKKGLNVLASTPSRCLLPETEKVSRELKAFCHEEGLAGELVHESAEKKLRESHKLSERE
jgi:hypothetical protein